MQDQDTVFVPVLPSYDGFFSNLSKTSKKAGAEAGRELSDALAAGVEKSGKAVDAATVQVEKAQNRAATAAENTRQKNMLLERTMANEKSTALDLAKAVDAVSKATRDQEAADKAAERAVKIHTDKTLEHQRAQDQANDATRQGTTDVDAYSGSLGTMGGSLKNIIGMAAGIGTVGAAISASMDISAATGKMNRQLGLTGESAQMMANDVREVMKTGMAGGADEAAEAIGSLNSQFKYLGSEGEQTATQLSDNFLAFTRTFDVDMAEATQTAGQLIVNGLAGDVESAADMMTAAMQRVPAQMRDELPEIINEYGTNFANLGYSGEEAFSLLVGASEKGKWALDKTGDALKEFTIRGSDMSKTSVEAYDRLGLSAQDMSTAVAAGGDGAREALQRVAGELLTIEDPSERANTAISLFGTQLEDLGIDQIPGFLENLTGAENTMQGFEGTTQAMADTMQNSLQGRLDSLKGTAAALASEGFMKAWDAAVLLADWARESQGWLIPVAIGIGSIAAGMAAWNASMAAGGLIAAIKGLTVVTRAQAAAQFLLNGAMWMSPITWIVAGIVALVAGLTYFFTQTETGRKAWESMTTALADGWDWVTEKVSAGWNWLKEHVLDGLTTATEKAGEIWSTVWGGVQDGWATLTGALSAGYENYIKPVFDGLVTVAKWAALIIGTVLLAPLMLGWHLLSTALSWGWENLIKPAFEQMGNIATWLWESVLQPVFGWIQTGWQLLGDGISWVYNTVILGVWNALGAAANWMWTSVLQPVFGWIQTGWKLLGDGFNWVYNNVILVVWNALTAAANWMWTSVLQPVFNLIKAGWQTLGDGVRWVYENIILVAWNNLTSTLTWMWENVVSPVLGWIGDKWDQMGRGMEVIWRWVNDNVFTPFKDGLTTLKDWFLSTADRIGEGWSTVKEKVKEPIQWVVETVFNKGILPAWNSVARLVGMDDKQLEEIHFAKGGTLPGYSPGVDDYRFVDPERGLAINLGGGESIMRPEWTRAVGGASAVRAMNDAAIRGGVSGVQRMLGEESSHANLGSFASGGVIGAMMDVVSSKYPMLQMTSGQRPGGGMHGAGLATDWSNGSGNTSAQLALAQDLATTYPGSAELIYDAPGWSGNIKNGQNVGAFGEFYTLAQAGPHHHHVHWGMTEAPTMPLGGGVFAGGSDGSGGGGNPIASIAKRAWDAVMDILPATPSWPGPVGEFPGAAKDFMVDTVWNFVKSKLPFGGSPVTGGVGAGVEQWRPLVESVLAAKGHDLNYADTVLRRMNQESGGNPSAINNWDSNASAGTPSKGLMQVIDPTFAAHMDPGYGDIWDPESNLRASMNYAIAQYGSLTAAYDRAGGYDSGGWVFPGKTLVNNESGVPEAVLTGGQWGKFYQLVDTVLPGLSDDLAAMAGELRVAYEGSDAGYGQLMHTLGNRELAQGLVDAAAALGRAERGFNEWAGENADHGSIGNVQEWGAHFGGYAAQEIGADALGLIGLEGLADITLSDSLVDLLNAAGHPASSDMFQPRDILDADNRVAKVAAEAVAEATNEALASTGTAGTTTASGVSTSGTSTVITIQVPAGKTAMTMDEVKALSEAISEKVGDIEIRLETVEESQTAGVDSGLTMMV